MADKFSSNNNSLNPGKNPEVSRQLRGWLSLLGGAKGTELRERNRGHVAAPAAEAAGNICRGWHRPGALAEPITDPGRDVPSGGRWSRWRTWHWEGPATRSRPRPRQPPTGTGAAARRGWAPLAAQAVPAAAPAPAGRARGAEALLPSWRGSQNPPGEATSENLFPKRHNPSDAWQLSPAPSWRQQHLPGQAGTRSARLPPGAWHGTKPFCARGASAPFFAHFLSADAANPTPRDRIRS